MRPKRLPTSLLNTPENTQLKAITGSALLCRPSAAPGAVHLSGNDTLFRSGEAICGALRGFQLDIASGTRQMHGRRRPAQQALDIFEAAKINLDERQWYAPELLRIRGELALGNDEGLPVCREYFIRALELSTQQASLSWALRAATSLAVAENSTGRKEAAWRTLQTTHAKIREGLETSIYGWPSGC